MKPVPGLSVLSLCLLLATGSDADTLRVGPGQPFATIQAAVEAAFAGDEIIVHDGLYAENVVVDKSVSVRADSWVVSSDNRYAVIDAGYPGDLHGVTVTAADAVIEGFSICNALGSTAQWDYRAAIRVEGADGARIANNRCGWDEDHRNSLGVVIIGSSGCEVTGNTTAEGLHGIWIEDSGGCLIQGNLCRNHSLDINSGGIYMFGDVDGATGLAYTSDNLITDNTFRDCAVGVYLLSGCMLNTIGDNAIGMNYIGVACRGGSSRNLFVGNRVEHNSNRGFWLNMSYENLVLDNRIDDCHNGIWLGYQSPSDYGCDNTLIVGNTITDNGYSGIRISAKSDDNRMFLNLFSGNLNNVVSAGTDWCTASAVSYFHGGNFQGRLGNRYDTYTGADLDGDGVGDEGLPFLDGDPDYGPVEDYPLVASPDDYKIQAWCLDGDEDRTMHCGDPGRIPGTVEIETGESVIWRSEHPAVGDVSFASGSWRGQLRFGDAPPAESFTIEIGTTTDGTDFTPTGAQAVVGGDWRNEFTTSAAAVAVTDRRFLALRLTSAAGWTIPVLTGGMASYVSSPGRGDPDWPHGTGTDIPVPAVPGVVLRQNVPNPFNPRTTIEFELSAQSAARLRVHDLAGRLIRTLLDRPRMPQGKHRAVWDGRDSAGRSVAAGSYIYRLEAGGSVFSRRMMLVR